MATATTKTTPTTEIPYAQEIREQLLSTVRQGQQLTVSAAQASAHMRGPRVMTAPFPSVIPR